MAKLLVVELGMSMCISMNFDDCHPNYVLVPHVIAATASHKHGWSDLFFS